MREWAEVLVIGGGPAGSTAATLLARQGFDVALLERAHFPRYHIGESLLPSLLPVLDLLGARSTIEKHGFVRKMGAFYGWGGQEWPLRFDDPSQPANYSLQVVRSEFDQLLLEHAGDQGVQVRQNTSVQRIGFHDDRAASASWSSGEDHGEIGFDHVIDASGRSGVLARQFGSRCVHDVFRNVAVWGYWRGTHPLAEAAPKGAIGVFSHPEHGWFWAIPLHDDTLSVGLVTDKRSFAEAKRATGSLEAFYHHAIPSCELLSEMLRDATLVTDLKVETDYSYVSDIFCGPGYFLAGDAACFLDPLLSTGVHLAMFSGLLAAASIGSTRRGEVPETAAQRFYDTAYRHAYERLLLLVTAFYRIHDGRDSYFRCAQTLSRRDQSRLRLHESFLNIVTGLEDLHDTNDHTIHAVYDALQRPVEGHPHHGLGGHGTSHMAPLPTSPDRAVEGLYLTTTPQLGLTQLKPRQAADRQIGR